MNLNRPPQDEIQYQRNINLAKAQLGASARVVLAEGELTPLPQAIAMLIVGHVDQFGDPFPHSSRPRVPRRASISRTRVR